MNTTEVNKLKLQNPFTPAEMNHLENSLGLAAKAYQRAQVQRPEFAEVAKQLEQDIRDLISKVKKLG